MKLEYRGNGTEEEDNGRRSDEGSFAAWKLIHYRYHGMNLHYGHLCQSLLYHCRQGVVEHMRTVDLNGFHAVHQSSQVVG